MSSTKGNIKRVRPQKHQNRTAFKNDLYDKSTKTKQLNALNLTGVCTRCKDILQWKIKYKKYKPLKSATACVKCHQRNITSAYRVICNQCSITDEEILCTKCLQPYQTRENNPEGDTPESPVDIQQAIKALSERKRRTLMRYINKQNGEKKKPAVRSKGKNADDFVENEAPEDDAAVAGPQISLDELIKKLSRNKVGDDDEDDDFGDLDSDNDILDSECEENDDVSDSDSLVSSENEKKV